MPRKTFAFRTRTKWLGRRFSQHTSLDGLSGLLASGRWHTRGHEILYCAPNPATALLEVLVHGAARSVEAFGNFVFLKIELPNTIATQRVKEDQLPPDWIARVKVTRSWGDRWLRQAASAVLLARSVLVPETYNGLLNPRHADARQTRVLSSFPYPLDPQLSGRSP